MNGFTRVTGSEMEHELRDPPRMTPRVAASGLAAMLAALFCAVSAHAQGTPATATPSATTPAPAATPAPADGAGDAGPVAGPSPAAAPDGAVSGMGDINLYPKRVVIDDHNRVQSVGLYNKTTNTGDYDISIGDMMMTSDGRLVDLTQVSDAAAKVRVKGATTLLRWSPHRVTLPGSEAQMVRIMAHVPPDLPPGEYRAHFSAVAVPPDDGGVSIQDAAGQKQASGIGVHITPRFGISIPVILRVGETTLTTGIADPSVFTIPGGGKALHFRITRSGTRSAFGDVVVTAPGQKNPVAAVRGVGVYTEIDARDVNIPFDPKADPASYGPGAKLTITYLDDDVNPGKTLVSQVFTVP